MACDFWCGECNDWVEADNVDESVGVLKQRTGEYETVYKHNVCKTRVVPAEEH